MELPDWQRGGMRTGGKTALIVGGAYLAVIGTAWTAKTIDRHVKRRQVLSELEAMAVPEEALTQLSELLATEVAQLVEERIAPLEQMVR